MVAGGVVVPVCALATDARSVSNPRTGRYFFISSFLSIERPPSSSSGVPVREPLKIEWEGSERNSGESRTRWATCPRLARLRRGCAWSDRDRGTPQTGSKLDGEYRVRVPHR